jgi:hypothetical protein
LQHGAFAAAACVAAPLEAWGGKHPSAASNSSNSNAGAALWHHSAHQDLNRDIFAGLIGSSFKATTPGGPLWLRLSAVNDPPALAPVNPARMDVAPKSSAAPIITTGYLVSFSGPGTSLAQGTYLFENNQLGSFPLFIVPSGPGSYTAVFNRLNS